MSLLIPQLSLRWSRRNMVADCTQQLVIMICIDVNVHVHVIAIFLVTRILTVVSPELYH